MSYTISIKKNGTKTDWTFRTTSGAIPWLTQLVIVAKSNGDVRLCINMRNTNRVIERTRFPSPTVGDLIFKLKGAKYFIKLDLNSTFHQLKLYEDSRYITAFQTEDRIKRFKRLLFGLNSASEQLQHYLQITLADIPGAINIADDILIFVESVTEHDEILKDVFQKLYGKGLTLNLSKCILSKE